MLSKSETLSHGILSDNDEISACPVWPFHPSNSVVTDLVKYEYPNNTEDSTACHREISNVDHRSTSVVLPIRPRNSLVTGLVKYELPKTLDKHADQDSPRPANNLEKRTRSSRHRRFDRSIIIETQSEMEDEESEGYIANEDNSMSSEEVRSTDDPSRRGISDKSTLVTAPALQTEEESSQEQNDCALINPFQFSPSGDGTHLFQMDEELGSDLFNTQDDEDQDTKRRKLNCSNESDRDEDLSSQASSNLKVLIKQETFEEELQADCSPLFGSCSSLNNINESSQLSRNSAADGYIDPQNNESVHQVSPRQVQDHQLRGLPNISCICFAIASLQALFASTRWRQLLHSSYLEKIANNQSLPVITKCLLEIANDIGASEFRMDNNQGVTFPGASGFTFRHDLTRALTEYLQDFETTIQEYNETLHNFTRGLVQDDAMDFIVPLLRLVGQEVGADQRLFKLFETTYTQQLECMDCHSLSERRESMGSLMCEISEYEDNLTIADMLENFAQRNTEVVAHTCTVPDTFCPKMINQSTKTIHSVKW